MRDHNPPEFYSETTAPGLNHDENLLLDIPLPHDLLHSDMEKTWARYQAVISQLLIRMGTENQLFDTIMRVPYISNIDAIYARVALIPKLGQSVLHGMEKHGLKKIRYQIAGECSLMELSAAAGYRTFCFPKLIQGLNKTGKMWGQPITRMLDTFEFLNTMLQYPLNDERVQQQLARTNGLHQKYKVARAADPEDQDLFKYIALNMFYIGPSMRPDLTPQERHALCGITVLVAKLMGHTIEGNVCKLESFIRSYEAAHMFNLDDPDLAMKSLRKTAVEIARSSKEALNHIPTISPTRIHGYVPYKVKKILDIV